MFGTQERFAYFECKNCGCLQITEPPKDMSKYYSQLFFTPSQNVGKKNRIRDFSLNLIHKLPFSSNEKNTLRLIQLLFPHSNLVQALRKTKVRFNSRILEIGCGKGTLMSVMKKWGFKNVTGVDPYACEKEDDLNIINATVHEIPNAKFYDLVIFDHSLEHIPDQVATLKKVSTILTNEGTCLIRLPLKTDYIWKKYGVNWVQIDAPRHFFLHTLKSVRILAEKTGMQICETTFDSTAFQFWGSEQYEHDIPLRAENSFGVNPQKSIFKKNQIEQFEEMARTLNKNSQGDQAELYLKLQTGHP